jgi:hypothetical protein
MFPCKEMHKAINRWHLGHRWELTRVNATELPALQMLVIIFGSFKSIVHKKHVCRPESGIRLPPKLRPKHNYFFFQMQQLPGPLLKILEILS